MKEKLKAIASWVAMMAVRVLGGTNPRGRDSTSEPVGCYRVREMTKIGQVAGHRND